MNVLLVIAEDRAICESLKAALPETDLVLFEPTAENALRRLISLKADVLILDDGPGLGLNALTRLRDATPSIPILVLSARGDNETLASYQVSGAQAALAKPFSCEILRKEIERLEQPAASPAERATSVDTGISTAMTLSRHQTAMRWLSRVSSYIKDPMRLSQSLLDSVIDIFDAVRCAVLLELNGNVRIAASHGIPTTVTEPLRLSFASGLMRWLEENPCLIDRNALGETVSAAKEMGVLGARFGVPLLCGGRVYGAILVGDKASGLEYSVEERELLTMVARTASISFENAKLYQEISRQRTRLDTLLANITAGVVAVRADKTIAMMNQSAERILQIRSVDVLGKSVQKLGSAFADVVLSTLADGKPRLRQEIQDRAIDARLGLSVTPLGGDGVVVIFSRLPEEQTNVEDIAYSPFWEYLASRVAQEIKNPMVAVNTFAQLLPRKYDSPDFREAFGDVVQKEVSRINSVVETLFEFARHARLVLQQSDVNETLRGVLRSFEDTLRNRSIRVETHLDPTLPQVDLDPIYFSQALHNVVQNSVEAMPEGGKLVVSTRKAEDACEVVIADSGPGIAEQDAPHIFMPFFSTKEQGMGLGLTVASRIMKQHRGELKLVPNAEGGGAFSFRLPITGPVHADHSSR